MEAFSMNDYGLSAYINQMKYVAFKISLLHTFFTTRFPKADESTIIEFETLQIRKIIEHIALGSLIANKDIYCQCYEKFEKCWNARLIFRAIERINSRFYPEPIKVDKSVIPHNCIPISESYMKKEEAIAVYDKCSSILHASNPFGSQPDIRFFRENIPKWHDDLVSLTNNHLIHMADGNHVYYVIMRSSQNGKPTGTLFRHT
jgi:hypothetical protein